MATRRSFSGDERIKGAERSYREREFRFEE
jgi:hypothetical protein